MGQNFYLDTRRALLHPSCTPGRHEWPELETIEDWSAVATVKLNALVQILLHHILEDDAAPLRVSSDGRTLEPCNDYVRQPRDPKLPWDRIVVYSEFPSSNHVIESVGFPDYV